MFSKNSVKLGIAPIGWTNDDLPELGGHIPFETCIREMAQAGFEGCEVGNKFPRDPETLKKALQPLGLRVASAWFSTYFTEDGRREETLGGFERHLRFLKAMEANVIVVCECGHSVQGSRTCVFDKPVFNDRQWEELASGLHAAGQTARAHGMKIVYHHHMGTGVQSLAEIDRLMNTVDPELVFLLLDTGHITYAGDSPVELARRYLDRIAHVHLKDIRREVLETVRRERMSFLESVKAGVFTVPGDGMVAFPPVFDLLARARYSGWFVVEAEQDPQKANPLEYARKARKFIRETAGL
ncbi:MAG: myo-inosose-2 dehydratase [Thermodesulfobacteriota bacterium]